MTQSIFNYCDFVLPSTVEIKKRGNNLCLKWKKPKLPQRRDRPEAKEILPRGTIRTKLRRSWPRVLKGKNRLRWEIGLINGSKKWEKSGTQAKGYLLSSAIFMFWLLLTFFYSTLLVPNFFLSYPFTLVLLLCADKVSFLALRYCLLLSLC